MPSGHDLYNSSTEEGIYPNVTNCRPIVPSYEREYDYENDYSNTPLVYSWLPIVPGFTQNGFDNLHNFQYLNEKDSECLDLSGSSGESGPIPNQNIKYHNYLVINNQQSNLLNNHDEVEFYELDNSCNATLNVLGSSQLAEDTFKPDLSFSGKIKELKATEQNIESQTSECEVQKDKQTEEERLHNESFELLKKEDSCKMLYINEKSPDLFDMNGEILSDELNEEVEVIPEVVKSSEDRDISILKKMKNSLKGICPPPSVTRFQMPLSEILTTYKKNINENSATKSTLTTSSFYTSSHVPKEVETMEWPAVGSVKCLDVSYNKTSANEDIEMLCLRYIERFIGAETTSSFNCKLGPSSAKKKSEKLK